MKENLTCSDELRNLSREEISSIIGRKVRALAWNGNRCVDSAEKSYAIMEKLGIKAFTVKDEGYPAMLSDIFDPPYMVFVRGNPKCLENRCVSIVGTRRLCSSCAENTLKFARDCAANGLTVVSGLAYGVDTFAHRGALSVDGGLTASVLPCGIDTVAPKGNTRTAAGIIEKGGLLLSEYLPGSPSESWRFVKRNRLIAALSSATVVMQAPPGSGALITVDFALGYNRYVMFHDGCFSPEAKLLTQKTVAALKEKGTREGTKKLLHSSENYVSEGAPVFGTYGEFMNILDGGQIVLKKENIQPELAF